MFQTLCDDGSIQNLITAIQPSTRYSLDCSPCVAVPQVNQTCKKQEKKMYENMYDNSYETEAERQKNYLSNSLSNAFWQKDSDLMREFNMNGTTPPQSPKEFVDFIKAGKFKFSKNWLNDDGSWRDDENHQYFNSSVIYQYITWVDPDKLPDLDGYREASKKMSDAKTKADRKIVVGTPAEGLAALEEFESATYH